MTSCSKMSRSALGGQNSLLRKIENYLTYQKSKLSKAMSVTIQIVGAPNKEKTLASFGLRVHAYKWVKNLVANGFFSVDVSNYLLLTKRIMLEYKWQPEYKVLRKVTIVKCKGCNIELCLICMLRFIKKIH